MSGNIESIEKEELKELKEKNIVVHPTAKAVGIPTKDFITSMV